MTADSVIWPQRIPNSVKRWVLEAAAAADTPGEEGVRRFMEYDDKDGEMAAFGTVAKGHKEIADLHRKAWEGVKHRKHVTHKVYSLADDGKDILVQGTLEFTTNDGTPGAAGFIVQAIFPTTSGDLAVAKQWKIWMDSSDSNRE